MLDPDGKPLVGAQVYLVLTDAQVNLHKLADSGADGRFRATISRQEIAGRRNVDRWRFAKIAATAQGYGPDWAGAPVPAIPNAPNREDLTLRMTKDDVPIAGRLITAEGHPVAGARVVALTSSRTARPPPASPFRGIVPKTSLAGQTFAWGALCPRLCRMLEGRFQIIGIGRDRLVTLRISGKDVAQQDLQVQTRSTAAAIVRPIGR